MKQRKAKLRTFLELDASHVFIDQRSIHISDAPIFIKVGLNEAQSRTKVFSSTSS